MKRRRPANPYLVLFSAIILPGSGQVWNGQPLRGLIFIFFILLLGSFTLLTAAPEASAIGRYAGGLFVWAMSMFDAYRMGRMRLEVWRHGQAG